MSKNIKNTRNNDFKAADIQNSNFKQKLNCDNLETNLTEKIKNHLENGSLNQNRA